MRRCKRSISDPMSGSRFFIFTSIGSFLVPPESCRRAHRSAAFRRLRYAIRHCSLPNSAQLADYFTLVATWVCSEPLGVLMQGGSSLLSMAVSESRTLQIILFPNAEMSFLELSGFVGAHSGRGGGFVWVSSMPVFLRRLSLLGYGVQKATYPNSTSPLAALLSWPKAPCAPIPLYLVNYRGGLCRMGGPLNSPARSQRAKLYGRHSNSPPHPRRPNRWE